MDGRCPCLLLLVSFRMVDFVTPYGGEYTTMPRPKQPSPTNSVRPPQGTVLDHIASRVLWLAVRMIHEANLVRPNRDGLKVGGHQASSASAVSIFTALYFRWLRGEDLVGIKPHASPAYHAIRYLLGDLDASYLTRLRTFGGLQSYPSRTKDPDEVDFSMGSVGLGAIAPLFASLADRYIRLHHKEPAGAGPERRFVAVIGDAELDEGSMWEAILDDTLRGLGNVTLIVDLNRQSLDRIVPGIKIANVKGMFAAAGWNVLEAKYGRRLQAVFDRPGGETLRRRIDDMDNLEYQGLIRRRGDEVRSELIERTARLERDAMAATLAEVPDDRLPDLLGDLGGHDQAELAAALDAADRDPTRTTIVFAYTIKGWRLPFAGDALNHSAMLTAEQIGGLATTLGVDPADPWARFPAGSPEERLCSERGGRLRAERALWRRPVDPGAPVPPTLDLRVGTKTSTQHVFGDAVAALARTHLVDRVVTASPDVSISTNLGGWINRVGVFALEARSPGRAREHQLLRWEPSPQGRHIEFGISEMNLFLWLGQAGLARELLGDPLIPIGTVYDSFVSRGLDALIYALGAGSRFIVAGTPSGVTLASEGGAHQSSVTPSIGIELPNLRMYEPAFGQEVEWCLLEGIRGCSEPSKGFSTYLRLTTREIDQDLVAPLVARLGGAEWRSQVLAGGYRLIEARELAPDLPDDAPIVNIMAVGAVIPEAIQAVRWLVREEVAANLIVVTSQERLAAELHERRLAAIRNGWPDDLPHLGTLIPLAERGAPIVTVADAASHALAFVGSAFGSPVVPLGVDVFGQSGTIPDLYAFVGIDRDHIVEAALLAIDLRFAEAARPSTIAHSPGTWAPPWEQQATTARGAGPPPAV